LVNVPNLETVGYRTFYGYSLTTISLPKAVSIGQRAFENCSSLTTVILGGTPPTITSDTSGIFYGVARSTRTITFKVPDVQTYINAGTPWSDKVNITNTDAGYYWDNSTASRTRLTVGLAAIE
jgi:hypothetical protein